MKRFEDLKMKKFEDLKIHLQIFKLVAFLNQLQEKKFENEKIWGFENEKKIFKLAF